MVAERKRKRVRLSPSDWKVKVFLVDIVSFLRAVTVTSSETEPKCVGMGVSCQTRNRAVR